MISYELQIMLWAFLSTSVILNIWCIYRDCTHDSWIKRWGEAVDRWDKGIAKSNAMMDDHIAKTEKAINERFANDAFQMTSIVDQALMKYKAQIQLDIANAIHSHFIDPSALEKFSNALNKKNKK